jgi:hypothetical protein
VVLTSTQQATQADLKTALQQERDASKLESLAAALVGKLLNLTVAVAKSGFQHGGDAGPSGRQERRFRLECKKYADTTSLSDRELLGEIDHALARDPALEAWVLVATREVPEQLEQSLLQKGESIGVPIIVIDWKPDGLANLAALCAFAPDLLEKLFSPQAGALARALTPISSGAIETLRLDFQAWSPGFELVRKKSIDNLKAIWGSRRTSNSILGQNAAGGAEPHKVRRPTVLGGLDAWWNDPAKQDAPVAVVGWDGVGKTWATLDWLVANADALPIVLVVPASAAASLSNPSEVSVKRFLADRIYELLRIRDSDHWLRRLNNFLKRPAPEGPVLTVFVDGLNQEPSVSWLSLLKTFQSDTFQGRLRILITTRTHYYENKLSSLRGLVIQGSSVPVDIYDAAPGGELDQMLAFEGLTQRDLHPDLLGLARTPRLFRLVVRFRERLVEAGQITVHRLLWEYGRDTFGERAGRSFSEAEWRAWLQEIARTYRNGISELSLKSLGEAAARPDLSEREVYARLSDIIDGQFTTTTATGALQFKPTVVAHALGAAVLAQLEQMGSTTFDAVAAELTDWLDPISGLDQRAEILRAAVSILVERGDTLPREIAGPLVTAWLQTQNITDAHRLELKALASQICEALLDAVEHSSDHAQASARLWAVNALRAIPRSDSSALRAISARAVRWLSIVSRGTRSFGGADMEFEKRRAERFVSRIGTNLSGPIKVLGLDMNLVDHDSGVVASTIPLILEGFPLAKASAVFEMAAVGLTVAGSCPVWDGLKWLCLLNENDPKDTTLALRTASKSMLARAPEQGINPALSARAAALLLWLTGHEQDDLQADSLDPGLDRPWTYEEDYLPNPARSLFPLERRHAADALAAADIALIPRIQRTYDLWFDPTFTPPDVFVEQLAKAVAAIDVDKLDRHSSHTAEDHSFQEIEPALARCAPKLLASLIRRKLQLYDASPPESRYWRAIRATDHLLLVGHAERASMRALRLSNRESLPGNETFASNQLLIAELHSKPALNQAQEIVSAGLEHIVVDTDRIVGILTVEEADALLAQFQTKSASGQRDLVIMLSHANALSDTAWTWLLSVAFSPSQEIRGIAFQALAKLDAARFGRELSARNWAWTPTTDLWTNDFGTVALIAGTTALPFDQVAPRMAPWRVLEAARTRGGDPNEVRLAAAIFGRVLAGQRIDVPDLGSSVSVERDTDKGGRPFVLSITPTPEPSSDDDPFAALKASMDTERQLQIYKRATEIAMRRIEEARKLGAGLYLAEVRPRDFDLVLVHAPAAIDEWLEGFEELTSDFKRRVQLAETAYLALCESLLQHDAKRGVTLWKALRVCLVTNFIGTGNIDELIHIAFRCPENRESAALRDEALTLERCHTDKGLLDLAVAASFNGKADWLNKAITADKGALESWRHRRALVLGGFQSQNTLPVADAWPSGEIRSSSEELRRKAGRFRYLEACARHWWRSFLAANDPADTYAAWILFLRSADRRAWTWLAEEMQSRDDGSQFFKLKRIHAFSNIGKLKRAMEKREENLNDRFLNRRVVEGLGPWGTTPQ